MHLMNDWFATYNDAATDCTSTRLYKATRPTTQDDGIESPSGHKYGQDSSAKPLQMDTNYYYANRGIVLRKFRCIQSCPKTNRHQKSGRSAQGAEVTKTGGARITTGYRVSAGGIT